MKSPASLSREPAAFPRCREYFVDVHALHAVQNVLAVDLVTVVEEIGWRGVVREGVHDLLGGPDGGGMLGDVEMDDPPAMVGKAVLIEQR